MAARRRHVALRRVGLIASVVEPDPGAGIEPRSVLALVPASSELALIGAGGLLVAVTYQTLVVAFRIGDMSFLAPFRYVSIPLSALFGWAVLATGRAGSCSWGRR